MYAARNISTHRFVGWVCIMREHGPQKGFGTAFGHFGPFLAHFGPQRPNLDVRSISTHQIHARQVIQARACLFSGGGLFHPGPWLKYSSARQGLGVPSAQAVAISCRPPSAMRAHIRDWLIYAAHTHIAHAQFASHVYTLLLPVLPPLVLLLPAWPL